MKKVLALSSVMLGVFFLAGCGQQPVSQTQPVTPAPVAQQPATNPPVATQPAPATSEVDETVSLKTYSNTEYGFNFKYPKDFLLDENQPGFIASVHSQDDNSGYGAFAVAVRSSSKSEVDKDIELFGKDSDNFKKTIIDGNQAFYSTSSYTEDGRKYTEYIITRQNNTMMFRVLFKTDVIGEKIFSTLKFTK